MQVKGYEDSESVDSVFAFVKGADLGSLRSWENCVLWRGKFSQKLNLACIHPNFLILSLVKDNKHILTILSKFAKGVALSYGPNSYYFEPPWSCCAVIFVEYLKIILWMFCNFSVPSIPARVLAVHFLFNPTAFFTHF